jgi:hypothetical protein
MSCVRCVYCAYLHKLLYINIQDGLKIQSTIFGNEHVLHIGSYINASLRRMNNTFP